MRALPLETIVRYGMDYALAYSDDSSTGGTGTGGYGIYFLWPNGSTTRICGPVGESTCSYECELIAVTECLRVVIVYQRKEPHCRAWSSLSTAGPWCRSLQDL
ncbi:hypothetical protein PoB_005030500 [Plakobranchus ocellatus]|uniref:RNase H type-1 domain-containing protein n=1 Tax=Plakobranchus ocellatus TaxID=259542 RepID=A0AAV4BTM6_9GAST|nr:hypothetical protein PoB_005030500 [Plakobranchus ocellatus]